MEKNEQEFTIKFQKWLRFNLDKLPFKNFIYEVKVVKEKKAMCLKTYVLGKREHQLATTSALSKGGCFIYKFSDYAQLGTPCDGVVIGDAKGVYVINWLGEKEFFIIDAILIDYLVNTGETHITKVQAAELSCYKGCIL
jgi:hypothetical protein